MHIAHVRTPYRSKCCTDLIRSLEIKNTPIPLTALYVHFSLPEK